MRINDVDELFGKQSLVDSMQDVAHSWRRIETQWRCVFQARVPTRSLAFIPQPPKCERHPLDALMGLCIGVTVDVASHFAGDDFCVSVTPD
jgi:hypothetical protein